MADIKAYYDPGGNTLTVWFGDPLSEHIAEETGEEIVLMKDKRGQVIGFEKLNFSPTGVPPTGVAFETVAGD